MISIETDVYNKVKTDLATQFPTLSIDVVEDYSPEVFPCVQIIEADNSTDKGKTDSGGGEKFSNVMFEVSVWAEGIGRKNKAKQIARKIDESMVFMGFSRISTAPLVISKTVFRLVIRYDAKVGVKGNNYIIYRR